MKNRRIPVLVKVPTLLVLIVAMSCATAQVLPTTAYSYDHAGRLQSVTAPLGQSTTFEYDVAGNLVQETHPAATSSEPSGIVAMGYTGSGTVSQVTDPRGLTTAYAINGFGNVTAQDSPDTGRTERGYDDAGNLVQSTDARGVTSRMAYDGLNRLVSIDYGDEQVSLTYGTSGTSAGKVVLMVDGSGQTAWTYDNAGNIASKTQTVAGRVLTVSYAWSGSRVTRITYPSGRVVGYTYDGANVAGISVDGVAIVTSVQYQPFGPVKSWSMGAAGVYSREFDKYGRVTGHSAPGGLTTIAWDANSNPASIQAAGGPARAYGYDGMDRLSSASEGGLGTSGFAYDLTGNRVQAEQGMSTFPYSVESDSNRLNNSSSAVEARTYQYDAAGNTLFDGIRSMTYNNAGRLVSVSHPNGGGTYRYNGAGQRVAKQAGAGSGVFLYAESEYDVLGTYGADGVASEEVIYLEGVPVALMRDGVIFYVLPDHLGTPRAIAKQDGALVWQWLSTAFGDTAPNTDPSGLGDFRFNGRFPGQRADLESGLVYNNARYYDPVSGRYTQSDPIGLAGGLNTYGYTEGNPLKFVDSEGRWAHVAVGAGVGALIGGAAGAYNAYLNYGDIGRGAMFGATEGGLVGAALSIGQVQMAGVLAGRYPLKFIYGAAVGVSANVGTQGIKALTCGTFFDPDSAWKAMAVGGAGGLLSPFTPAFTQVTSYAPATITPAIGSGTWVVLGEANVANWISTGTVLGKHLTSSKNFTTTVMPASQLKYPPGVEAFKGFIGQRVVK